MARKPTKAAKASKKARPKSDASRKRHADVPKTGAKGTKKGPAKPAKNITATKVKGAAKPPSKKANSVKKVAAGSPGKTKGAAAAPKNKKAAESSKSATASKAVPKKAKAAVTPIAAKSLPKQKGKASAGDVRPASSGAGRGKTPGAASRPQNVAPGRKFVKRAGAVLAQPQTPKASIRTPVGAEELKARIGALSKAVSRVRALKRNVNEAFWEIGEVLHEVEQDRLFEVKGYASFDSFVDREAGLSKRVGVALARVPAVFVREAAETAGLDRVLAALDAFDGDEEGSAGVGGSGVGGRSPIPYHKQ